MPSWPGKGKLMFWKQAKAQACNNVHNQLACHTIKHWWNDWHRKPTSASLVTTGGGGKHTHTLIFFYHNFQSHSLTFTILQQGHNKPCQNHNYGVGQCRTATNTQGWETYRPVSCPSCPCTIHCRYLFLAFQTQNSWSNLQAQDKILALFKRSRWLSSGLSSNWRLLYTLSSRSSTKR